MTILKYAPVGSRRQTGYMWENSIQSAYELNVAQEYQLYYTIVNRRCV